MVKNLRYSRQRERIYEYLITTAEHPTAEMVHSALRKESPELSLGTVYRNLKLLEELGRVRRVTTYDGSERYDAICENHAHFICETCGTIRDIPEVDSGRIRDGLELKDGYRVSKLDMILTGTCPACNPESI